MYWKGGAPSAFRGANGNAPVKTAAVKSASARLRGENCGDMARGKIRWKSAKVTPPERRNLWVQILSAGHAPNGNNIFVTPWADVLS